jgi:hypothetical protein
MIAVDINDVVELHDAGLRVLEEGLGPEAADAFLSLSFCGRGDYTAEKYSRPPKTKEETAAMLERIKARARERGQL